MGYPFIFNGIPSEQYEVSLIMLDGDYTQRSSGSDKNLVTTNVRRNARKLYLDTQYEEVLTFDIVVAFESPVDIYTLTAVKDWLSGAVNYEQLQICAENFDSFYYNCIIHPTEDLIYNGGYEGVKCTVECDAPWAWEFTNTEEYSLVVGGSNYIEFNNSSDDHEVMRAILSFHISNTPASAQPYFSVNVKHYNDAKFMLQDGSTILLNNATYQECRTYCKLHGLDYRLYIKTAIDYDKTTVFSNILQGDTVYMDNQYGIITASLTPNIVQHFNKVFFKLQKGVNELTITGDADKMYITYENAKRLGGGYY